MTCEICRDTGASLASQLYGALVSYCTCAAGLERLRRDFPMKPSAEYLKALDICGDASVTFDEHGAIVIHPIAAKYGDGV